LQVFEQRLRTLLSEKIPTLDPSIVTTTSGATNLISNVRAATDGNDSIVRSVLEVYNQAITNSFYAAAAFGGLTLVFALAVEWKSVKEEKQHGEMDVELSSPKQKQ
jgi:hypothetical protein